MEGVSGAAFWCSRWVVALLGLLAVAELTARLTINPTSIARTPLAGSMVRAAVNGTIVRTSGGGVSTQFFLLLCLVALGTTLPLGFRRAAPAAVVLSAASILSLTVFQLLPLTAVIALLIAGYRLGNSNSRELVGFLSVPFLVLALAGVAENPETDVQIMAIGLAALIPTAAVAGISRRARTETQANTAAQQTIAGRWHEHTVRGERARISRELHDVVAHHVSMIAVQAETARLTVPGMPSDGAKQLLSIGNTARAALAEMRRLLGVLREDIEDEAAERQPQPGLRQLNELLDEARDASDAGIRLIVRGPPDPLEPGVELAVYRIVQESLTNARRHAPGAAVDVELLYTQHTLRLRIRDNGPGPVAEPALDGHGLLGIRERATAVGGHVQMGPAPGGGFLIEACLPTAAKDTG